MVNEMIGLSVCIVVAYIGGIATAAIIVDYRARLMADEMLKAKKDLGA